MALTNKEMRRLRKFAQSLNPLDPRRREIAEAIVLAKLATPPTLSAVDAHYTDAAQLAAWRQERGD